MEVSIFGVVAVGAFAMTAIILMKIALSMLGIALMFALGKKYNQKPQYKLGLGLLFLMALVVAVFV